MIYKKIATSTKTAIEQTNALVFLWEQSVQTTIATIRSTGVPTILMDDGFQMDAPIYDGVQSLIAHPEIFETPEWAAFHRSLTTAALDYLNGAKETQRLTCESLGFHTHSTAPELIHFLEICIQNWHEKTQCHNTGPLQDTDSDTDSDQEETSPLTQKNLYPTPGILIPTSPDTVCDPEILSLCKERANSVPPNFQRAKQMLASTLAAVPLFMGATPLRIDHLISGHGDIRHVLAAVHDVYLTHKYPIKQPLRFIQDYIKFGDNPFLNTQDHVLITTLQKHIHKHTVANLKNLHKALRDIIPHQATHDYCNQRCLWILDKLTKLNLHVGTIEICLEKTKKLTLLTNQDQWTHHIAPVIFLKEQRYVVDVLISTILTPEDWVRVPWVSDAQTYSPNITLNQGYHATESDLKKATDTLARLYYRELETPLYL